MLDALDALDDPRGRQWVGGGWGVDVLVGQQTREHRDGARFDYPPDAFTVGTLNGRQINCLSVLQHRDFHAAHEHQAKDEHDLAQLNAPDQP